MCRNEFLELYTLHCKVYSSGLTPTKPASRPREATPTKVSVEGSGTTVIVPFASRLLVFQDLTVAQRGQRQLAE